MIDSSRGGVAMRLALVVSLTLGLTGCGETSKVDPNAKVTISGTVTTPSGEPLTDRPVRLATGASGGDLLLGLVTLGLACTSGICDDRVRSVRTKDDGTYRIELKGRDTQTDFGNVRTQVLSAAAAPVGEEVSGASVAAQFVVQTERVRIPPLQLVDPGLSFETSEDEAVASWEPALGAPYTLSFETDNVVPVWRVTTAETAASVDGRVLEDSSGRVVVSGETTDQIEGSNLDLTWRSPGVGYAAEGVPMSRGASCRYSTASRVSRDELEQSDCLLTDGDLFSGGRPGECLAQASPPPSRRRRCATPTRATIDMASAAPVDLIVVRGCEGTCRVETSADGRTFHSAGTATGPFAALPIPLATVRSVRVSLGRSGLREVSIWGPEARVETAVESAPESALEELRAPYESVEESGGSRGVLVIAALLGAALIVVAYLLGRTRGRAKGVA